MLGYCGMVDLCVFKAVVKCEVASSQQLLLKQSIIFFLQESEKMGQALKLQFACTNQFLTIVSSDFVNSHFAGNKSLEDRREI